jgi:thiamine biosynthesis lipoprotein
MQTPRSNRRDFLKGAAAVRAGEHLLESQEVTLAASPPSHLLVKYSQRAMACDFEVWLNDGQYAQGPEAALTAFDVIQRIEDQLTVYRTTSEVSALNRDAAERAVVVDEGLFGLLEQAKHLWQETGGAFANCGVLSDDPDNCRQPLPLKKR